MHVLPPAVAPDRQRERFAGALALDHGTKLAEGRPAEIQSDPRVLDAYLGT